ncbi:MAG: metallophosphoesterase [Abditibacteriota bacterium]|nr:metallophosphoesterase [Abditibacteriota bacterium]
MKKLAIVLALALALGTALYASGFTDFGKAAAKKADLAFLWASDTHHQAETGHGAQKDLMDSFVSEANETGVDFAALTGDLVHGNKGRKSQLGNLAELRDWLDGCKMPVMPAMGNHDDGSWYIKKNLDKGTAVGLGELVPKEDFFGTILKGHEGEFKTDPKNPYGGWYYKDFTKAKIRVIVLNVIDIPYIPDGGGLKYYGQWNYGFRQEQLDWLANKALKFSKKGWGVIVMTHMDYGSEYLGSKTMPVNSRIVEGLLEAFAKKEAGAFYSDTEDFEAKVKYNFRHNGSNEFIASFAGHRHNHYSEYVAGVPHVVIGNLFNPASGGFYLVTVDRKKRRISAFKCFNGAAAPEFDRVFGY